jgi:hypothetical protein
VTFGQFRPWLPCLRIETAMHMSGNTITILNLRHIQQVTVDEGSDNPTAAGVTVAAMPLG